ncbi:MAG: phenylalanine--tRNA ligase subunit beta [Bacteriovoracia bacterium]
MKISLNWLSELVDVSPIRKDVKGFVSALAMRGIEIESINDLSKGLEDVVVASVEQREKHPNADRLSVCKVNDGTQTVQVVCGAANVRAGLRVAFSKVGAHLPNGLKIEKSKIRNVESFGMICSEEELKFSETSEGILELPNDAPVGMPLAQYLDRNDVVFEVAATPNRGDLLSHLGFAREVAALYGSKVELKRKHSKTKSTISPPKELSVEVKEKELCLQYYAQFIDGVEVKSSPAWLKKRIEAIGLRPISNVVDVTNYVLHEMGLPLHAFDYDKLALGKVVVRRAQDQEKIKLLDDSILTLTSEDLIIADGKNPIALAGVMGGADSEVTKVTKRVLLEAAHFLPESIRRTARRYQKQTDASYRFERKVDALAIQEAIGRATELIIEVAGGKALKEEITTPVHLSVKLWQKGKSVNVQPEKVSEFLTGKKEALDMKTIQQCLSQIGIVSKASGKAASKKVVREIACEIPSYRPDIEIKEDIYEEVLRIWGYDQVEASAPILSFIPEFDKSVAKRRSAIAKARAFLVSRGFSETINFAFTSGAKDSLWTQNSTAVLLENPISEDLNTLRSSLLSGLFDNLVTSVHRQENNVRLFEIRPVYAKDESAETGVREEWRISGILSGRAYCSSLESQDRELEFSDVKGIILGLMDSLGTRGYRFMEPTNALLENLHQGQAALIAIGKGPCGFLAKLHPKVLQSEKIRVPVFAFDFSLESALQTIKDEIRYSEISKFPKVHRSLSLVCPLDLSSDKILNSIAKTAKPLIESARVVDIYRGKPLPDDKQSLSVEMVFSDLTKTLEDAEIDNATQRVLKELEQQFGLYLRSS